MEEIITEKAHLRNKRLQRLALVSKNLREVDDKIERLIEHQQQLKNRKHSLKHLLQVTEEE